jgi:DNA-directed RNA polymerase beta subunit
MKELEAQQPSYRSLAAPVTNPVDKFALLPAFLKVRGLVKEHIDSFNYFITMGIRKIIEANNRIEARNDPNIYLKYVLSVHSTVTLLLCKEETMGRIAQSLGIGSTESS